MEKEWQRQRKVRENPMSGTNYKTKNSLGTITGDAGEHATVQAEKILKHLKVIQAQGTP